MSDLIIKIGDDALDLKTDEVIAITKQAAKVGDFSAVLADGTNEVSIPATSRNKSILDNSDLLQTESELPYRRNDATLTQEGYETIQDGFALIESFGKDFRIQLVGGNASFFNLIKDLNLRDLDLTIYDHFWTNQNVFDNRNNTSGFIYALFEQSDQPTSPTLSTYGVNLYAAQTELLLPVFYEKTLIAAIFAEQGYSFVSDITSTNLYDKAVVFAASTPNRGNDVENFLNFTMVNSAMSSGVGSEVLLFQGNGVFTEQPSIYWDIGVNPAVSFYGVSDNSTVTFTATLDFTNNDTAAQTGVLNIYHTTPDGVDIIAVLLNFPVGATTINISETFDCVINPSGNCGFDLESSFAPIVDIEAGSTFSCSFVFISNNLVTTNAANGYDFIRGITPVPDMKQGDFLKDVAKKYQLIYDVDELTHTVYARRFDKVKENIVIAKDLSAKLHDEGIETTYRVDGYAQTNYLKWKEDDITKWTAQGIINVDDTTLEAEKTTVEMSQFAASSAVSRFDTKQVPYIPLFDVDQLPTNGMTDRMLIVRSETFPYNINFNRGSDLPTDTVTFAYFAEAGNEDSLDFPTLITRFYVALQDMLYRAKTITCKVKLGIKDVMDYNPFIPVYIQKFNAFFYWEKLENYVKGKLVKIKLIRL